jgi:alpha-galactosidase
MVQAIVTQKREHVYHAVMMNPHTAAKLDLQQVTDMIDDLISAHGSWLPEWVRD